MLPGVPAVEPCRPEGKPIVRFHPVRVLTSSEDQDGVIVFVNDGLVGVLVRLSPPRAANAPTFDTLESADRWFRERLSGRARRG